METSKTTTELITLVGSSDINGVKNYILSGKGKIDETDENGMSPLQHAAYKGQYDMCKMLLYYGANVNLDLHDHSYSALHFAALSGNVETVKLLLASGAKTYHTNTLKRTAAQMAGFVGNRAVVALINNYVPPSEVTYYTTLQGLETVPRLHPEAAEPLYSLIMQTNLHPVYVALSVEKNSVLIKYLSQAAKVLSLMCEKEAKRPQNVNEVLCLKFHFLSCILKALENLSYQSEKEDKEKALGDKSPFEGLMKKWLIGRLSDGFEEHLESFVRGAIKSYPYVEMPLFIQLVRNISSSKHGGSGFSPDILALDVLHGLINGQRPFDDGISCSACGFETPAVKRCSKCKSAQYCNKKCQRLHWHTHKKMCDKFMRDFKKKEQELKKQTDNKDKKNIITEKQEKEEQEKIKQGDNEDKENIITEKKDLKTVGKEDDFKTDSEHREVVLSDE